MNEMKIVIDGMAELTEAIRMLAGKAGQQAAPVQGYGIPAQQTPPYQQVPVTSPAQPAVPTAAPSYTPDDLARAGMVLMDAGRQAELQQQLARFGVEAIPSLPPAQYGAFATALREMGAPI